MEDTPDRGVPSNMRGWLSEVYVPALVSAQAEQLMRRLGGRATVDDPVFGRATGSSAVARHLEQAAAWFSTRSATFERTAFTTGSDRDVTEGTLGLALEGKRVLLPVAIVAERRPEREVEVRLYYATKAIHGTPTPRGPLVPRDDNLTLPPPVAAHLQALSRGDLDAVVAGFEDGATLRDPAGVTHARTVEGAGGLRAFYESLLGGGVPRVAGLDMIKGARADDGRTCALEYTVARLQGRDMPPQPGLAVYERGQSGLLRTVRLYHE